MKFENSLSFAKSLDAQDELRSYRQHFHIPKHQKKDCIYFCGNSLGLQPKNTEEFIRKELEDWRTFGVEAHFEARKPWFPYHEFLRDDLAKLVGAKPKEVVAMNSLTLNLHLMLVSFYRPSGKRRKIIMEYSPFPSDRYALASHLKWHGFDPKKDLIELKPDNGSYHVSTEKIISCIQTHKNELALVMMGAVNYYTGQYFELEKISKAAHEAGAIAGFDLAHAAGNKEMFLHKWGVDFAVWCSYKYLNAGPGSVAAAFVHEKHLNDKNLFRFAGWWGNDPKTRFTMPDDFIPVASADAWQLSNAPVLSMAALCASMKYFMDAHKAA
ncbi:MAG TPA: kynureninase, partial [Bacteroidia bacterium]|nr:kynureninase [Bacteroidia bacterium]